MLSFLAMCTPPVLDSPYPLPPPVYRESAIVEEDEDELQFDWRTPSKSTHKTTPSRTPARALILPSITPKSSNINLIWHEIVSPSLLRRKPTHFDILTSLPPELGLKILHYLHPQDLCNVCLVSHKWNTLARYQPLDVKRKKYLTSCREDYQQSKENYTPFYCTTPHQRRHMTNAASPLNIVQPKSAKKHHHHHSYSIPADHTPSPAYLSDTVKMLSLEDNSVLQDTRRCLFPESVSELRDFTHSSSSRVSVFEGCSVVGKKSNRNRLRRL